MSYTFLLGAGGGILGGILLGHTCVCAVEIEPYCRKVLLQRQRDGILPKFPIWDDVRTFDGRPWRGRIDCLSAGFPCQPFSVEGNRDWNGSSRNLWPETRRIIKDVQPQCVLLENVRGIRRYLPMVVRDLRRDGFTVYPPRLVSAARAGAIHIRERVWVRADANSNGRVWQRNKFTSPARTGLQTWAEFTGLVQDVLQSCVPSRGGRGIHDGASNRVDRLKATGNGQVPAVVKLAWETLSQ